MEDNCNRNVFIYFWIIQRMINFIKMRQHVLIKQNEDEKRYLNPSQSKIRQAFTKKSAPRTTRKNIIHTRNISLDSDNCSRELIQNGQANEYKYLKVILNDNSTMLKEIKHALVIEKPVQNQLKMLKQKNASLEADLKLKDQKIESLREKYEDILFKFEQFSNTSKNNSFNTSFDSNTNRSVSISKKGEFTGQLKRIRERLKQINFSKIFMLLNKFKPSPSGGGQTS